MKLLLIFLVVMDEFEELVMCTLIHLEWESMRMKNVWPKRA